ncbi:MAG TPA: hypothetical protein VMI34_04350 [Candidatus Bathyarchaeia archaeon]|nr:hypothetical protein [Candidatus Bathyarchaeia archaeon]
MSTPLEISKAFTWNVTVGVVVMLAGAALALAVSIWWELAKSRAPREGRSLALGVSGAAAMTIFWIGVVWQLVGYMRLEYTTWWTW